jgi:zinc transporter ZupT
MEHADMPDMIFVEDLVILALFSLVHLIIPRMTFIDVIPRSRWLSFAGGVALAYVFLHILPQFHDYGEEGSVPVLLYTVALFSFVLFYSLEQLLSHRRHDPEQHPLAIFWLHVGSFALYNVLVGWLLYLETTRSYTALLLYAVAIGAHLVTTDYGLWKEHASRYILWARWILSLSLLAGWGVPLALSLSGQWTGYLFAFVAGATILNVIKEELPQNRLSFSPALIAGAALFSIVLLLER